ncbi:MAG: 2-keto-3-deoxygluconate permease [Anaerotignum sp.]|nr:2-keto-3-deoxygluconate permease [Anaerotignum sp.]
MIPIKDFIDKVPGGVVIIPLLLGCFINTFFPEFLEIGGFTTSLAKGTSTLMGALFLCLGAQLNLKCAPKAIKTGMVLFCSKISIAILIGWISAKYFNNHLLGLSMLAIVAAVSNSNSAMYATLTAKYGSESEQGAVSISCLSDGPFCTLLIMGVSGTAEIPYISIIASIVPLLVGVILGTLDQKMRICMSNGLDIIVILLCFSVGCTMNIGQIAEGGFSGVLLGMMAVFIGGFFNIFVDRMTGGSGVAGAAISSVAANAIATPAAIAVIDGSFRSVVGVATAQIAAASIVTCLVTPFLTAWVAEQNHSKNKIMGNE